MHYLVGIAVLLLLTSAVVQFLASVPVWAWVAFGAVIFFGFVRETRRNKEKMEKAAEEQRLHEVVREQGRASQASSLNALIAKHSGTLQSRYSALAAANGYGKPDTAAWEREVKRFVESIDFKPTYLTLSETEDMITRAAQTKFQEAKGTPVLDWTAALSSPLAFEQACAAQLVTAGWEANTTAGSGDQGIDVFARKSGVRAVLQCKLYSQAVGNDAVQEALAGKAFAKAHVAAVVSNVGFTRKAHELAAATGVLLLHYSQLDQLDTEVARVRLAYAKHVAARANQQDAA